MAINKAFSQYKEDAVFTSSPEELTLMLYNGLVKFIMQAQKAIDEKNLEKANSSIIRAQDIVNEFRATLNMKYEISKNLRALYDYMYERLVTANIKKDKEILEEILDMSKELRDTWAEAMKRAKKSSKGNTQLNVGV